jgi:hypothetical protein
VRNTSIELHLKPGGAFLLLTLALLGCSKSAPPPPVEPKPTPALAPAKSVAAKSVIVSRVTFTNPPSFACELRLPAAAPVPPEADTEWFAGEDALGGQPLFLTPEREENGQRVFTATPTLFLSTETNQTFVVVAPGRPAEVFCFPAPPEPYTDQWSDWRKPTYTEPTEFAETVVDATQPHRRRTNDPAALFEFRFKFTAAPPRSEMDENIQVEMPEESP